MSFHFRFCAVGDFHLDKLDSLFGDQTNDLLFNEWGKPAEYALKNNIKYLVLLGDIADKARLSEEARVTLQKFLHKYDGQLNIHIILGNHDVEYRGYHSLEAIEHWAKVGKFKTVTVHTKPRQEILNGIPVNFLPFPHTKAIEYKGRQTLNFAHLERPNSLRDNGTRIEKDHGVPEDKDGHKWVIGHLHTPHDVGNSHFVGTLYQTNFGERLPKSFTVGKAKMNGKQLELNLERIDNKPAFILKKVKIESIKDLKKLDDNPLHLFKVTVNRGVDIPYDLNTRYPNIVNHVTKHKTNKEANSVLKGVEEVIKFDLTSGLIEQLIKQGLTDKQAKRGLKMVETYMSNL